MRVGIKAAVLVAAITIAGCGDESNESEDDARGLVDSASAELNSTLERGRAGLSDLAAVPAVKNHDVAGCNEASKELVASLEDYSVAGAAAPDGDLWCLTLPLSEPVNVTDRAYFQLATGSGEFSVGDYQTGRVSGDETIVTSAPVEMTGEQRPGVVLVSIDLVDFAKLFARSTDLPEGGQLIVTDAHGTVLASAPDPGLVGRNLSGTPLVQDMLEEREGSGTYTLEERELSWAFTAPEAAPEALHVAAGIGD